MNSQEYIEVSISIEPFSEEAAEIVEAEIAGLPYDSFLIDTENSLTPVLKAYIQKDLYDSRALKLLLSGLDFKTSFCASLIPPQNWNAVWESSFTPIVVGRSVTVKSPEAKNIPRTRFNITIEPRMAFGTGHHITTFMMIESMLAAESRIRGAVVMDMGCGTAVLGILAAKMRAGRVYGIDIDAVAARSAYDNARLNRVGRIVETYCGDASLLQAGRYDVLLANIHRNVIIADMKIYARSLRGGGLLTVSGFFEEDAGAVIEAAVSHGLRLVEKRGREGWSCLNFQK